mmetsp:Transcript_13694/g.18983  ORF Transcript_13694/g.18983 Transcript_13694/m.18983 type:complete len:189 (+) Transcript_13694:1402-1968(+)
MTKDNNLLGKFDLSGIPPAPRGVPQVEVTFDIDANGILNVSAKDKAGGNVNQITITNDKGRMSKEEIERLVQDAGRWQEEDQKIRQRVEAKNGVENYAYSLRNTLKQESIAEKLPAGDKESLMKAIDETISWLDSNLNAAKEEYEERQKQLEGIAMPIMTKLYQGGAMPGGMPDQKASATSPQVDEVD